MEQTSQNRGRNRGRAADGGPNPVDIHVGARIRLRRTLLGLSQEKLGEALGITFQQVQKYERGANRVGASRLYSLSKALEVPVSFFFDGFEPEQGANHAVQSGEETDTSRKTLELVRNFSALDTSRQSIVSDLAKGLASEVRGAA